jgi:hypothetical protein
MFPATPVYNPRMYFAPPKSVKLRTDLSPEECVRRLGEKIDPDQPTTFGFSGYRGTKPFVGTIEGLQIRLLQRVYSGRTTLPTVLTGEFKPHENGTELNGSFDLETTSKLFLSMFSVLGLLLVVLFVRLFIPTYPILSVLWGCVSGVVLIFLPRLQRNTNSGQETAITAFLQEILVASASDPHPTGQAY